MSDDQVKKGQLSDDELRQAERIQKLLNTAANPGTPEEGEAALKLAQQLMLKYNLDQSTVEGNVGLEGKREQGLVDGGFYAWKRELWAAVADVHFCLYWSQKYRTKELVNQTERVGGVYVGMRKVHAKRRRHALVGRAVNVRMAQALAQYLEGAIERALREAIAGKNAGSAYEENAKSNWAHSWRQGAGSRITQRLRDRHEENVAREEQERRRAARKATGASTGTSLVVAEFAKAEEEANYDFVFGEGWSAKQRAKRQARAEEREQELREYREWAEANPEEVRAQAEEERKREEKNARRRKGRWGSSKQGNTDYGAYYSGSDAAEKIGLDPQTGDARGRKDQKRIVGSKDIRL